MAQPSSRSKPTAAAKASPGRKRSVPPPGKDKRAALLPVPKVEAAMRRAFRQSLVGWYRRQKRDLPWRRTRDPYAVAVSEFMLQQTQVATVTAYYRRWLEQFPDWAALAAASEEQVVKAWEGLGYYRRARTLHRLARTVVATDAAELPADLAQLQALPGIGPYTARAIGSIAFGLRGAVVDGNVMRVLARVFDLDWDIAKPATAKAMQALADELAPRGDRDDRDDRDDGRLYGDYNQAVMELGALVCTPRSPRCLPCPLQSVCQAGEPESLPVKTRAKTEEKRETVAVIVRQVGGRAKWWLERPPEGERLDAMWRFPHFDPATMKRAGEGPTGCDAPAVLMAFTYGITKYRVRLEAVVADWSTRAPRSGDRQGWFGAREIEEKALASAHRKIWAKLRADETSAPTARPS